MKRMDDLPAGLRLGLIGWPVSHSHSPEIHRLALAEFGLQGEYKLYPVPPLPDGEVALKDLLWDIRRGKLHGLNVTIPHKQAVQNLLDELTVVARKVGAVNTIFLRQGRLTGDNTDVRGFLGDLAEAFSWEFTADGTVVRGDRPHALVLGAGGAARGVVFGLISSGWSVTVAARRIEQAQNLVSSFVGQTSDQASLAAICLAVADLSQLGRPVDLVVNATPLGMVPDTQLSPWPQELPLPAGAVVYDLVYNPLETSLIKFARQNGHPAANGLGMLVEQAALAFECWTGLSPSREVLKGGLKSISL